MPLTMGDKLKLSREWALLEREERIGEAGHFSRTLATSTVFGNAGALALVASGVSRVIEDKAKLIVVLDLVWLPVLLFTFGLLAGCVSLFVYTAAVMRDLEFLNDQLFDFNEGIVERKVGDGYTAALSLLLIFSAGAFLFGLLTIGVGLFEYATSPA